MASDLRLGTERSRVAFLFVRVGLAGCDMGACAMLPRIIGLGRAASCSTPAARCPASEAHAWGFYNELCAPDAVSGARDRACARRSPHGPTLAHAMTKRMLLAEWSMPLLEAIDAEAVAQATLMESNDFRRAYEAFLAETPAAFRR